MSRTASFNNWFFGAPAEWDEYGDIEDLEHWSDTMYVTDKHTIYSCSWERLHFCTRLKKGVEQVVGKIIKDQSGTITIQVGEKDLHTPLTIQYT